MIGRIGLMFAPYIRTYDGFHLLVEARSLPRRILGLELKFPR